MSNEEDVAAISRLDLAQANVKLAMLCDERQARIAELEGKLAEAVDLCERGALAGQILEALRGQ